MLMTDMLNNGATFRTYYTKTIFYLGLLHNADKQWVDFVHINEYKITPAVFTMKPVATQLYSRLIEEY